MEGGGVVPTYDHAAARRNGGGVAAALRTVSGIATRQAFRRACCEVAGGLEGVVGGSLGPDGVMRCAVDLAGQASFTMQGSRLLLKARSTHPIAEFVLRGLRGFESDTGDGTKRWVILLHHVLRGLDGALAAHGGIPAASVARYRDAFTTELRQALANDDHTSHVPCDVAVRCAVGAALTPGCAPNIAETLATLLMNYLVGTHEAAGYTTLVRTPPSKANIRTVHGAALAQSKVVRGVLIEGRPSHPQMPKLVKQGRVLLLTGRPLLGRRDHGAGSDSDASDGSSSSSSSEDASVTSSEAERQAAREVHDTRTRRGEHGRPPTDAPPRRRKRRSGHVTYEMTADELADANEWAELAAKMFVLAVGGGDVAAVLSATPLPEAVHSECAQVGVFVADRVERCDLILVADALGAAPLAAADVVDPTGAWDPAALPVAATLEWMPVSSSGGGAGSFLRIVPAAAETLHTTILLAAPTRGLADDYTALVRRCIQAARFVLREPDAPDEVGGSQPTGGQRGIPVVGAGGKALLVAARVARRCARPGALAGVPGTHLRYLSAAVGDALEEVVVASILNTLGPRGRHEARQLVTRAADEGKAPLAMLHVAGRLPAGAPRVASLVDVVDPEEVALLEAAEWAPHLVHSVLTTVAQLYRIDMLAPSKRLSASGSQHVQDVALV